jgi:hypothetical protein
MLLLLEEESSWCSGEGREEGNSSPPCVGEREADKGILLLCTVSCYVARV